MAIEYNSDVIWRHCYLFVLFQSYFAHFYYLHFYNQDSVFCNSYIAIDVFSKSFIIISIHRWHHVVSEMGFKQDSSNPSPDSNLLECTFLLNSDSDSLCIQIQIPKSNIRLLNLFLCRWKTTHPCLIFGHLCLTTCACMHADVCEKCALSAYVD